MSNCKQCGKEIMVVEGRRKREFCDNKGKCRNEFYRKNKKPIFDLGAIDNLVGVSQEIKDQLKKSFGNAKRVMIPASKVAVKEYALSKAPPMPTREKNEDSLAFAERKNAWKKKYG